MKNCRKGLALIDCVGVLSIGIFLGHAVTFVYFDRKESTSSDEGTASVEVAPEDMSDEACVIQRLMLGEEVPSSDTGLVLDDSAYGLWKRMKVAEELDFPVHDVAALIYHANLVCVYRRPEGKEPIPSGVDLEEVSTDARILYRLFAGQSVQYDQCKDLLEDSERRSDASDEVGLPASEAIFLGTSENLYFTYRTKKMTSGCME